MRDSVPLAGLRPAQRAFHEQDERLLHMGLAPGIAQDHGHIGRDAQRLAHLARMMRGNAVEEVARNQPALSETPWE